MGHKNAAVKQSTTPHTIDPRTVANTEPFVPGIVVLNGFYCQAIGPGHYGHRICAVATTGHVIDHPQALIVKAGRKLHRTSKTA